MRRKDILKFINEEISGYDFLGTNSFTKKNDMYRFLDSAQFQNKFISDVISNKQNIKIIRTEGIIGPDWTGDNYGSLYVDYQVDVLYYYNQKDCVELSLAFSGGDIGFHVDKKVFKGDGWWTPDFDDSKVTEIAWTEFNIYLYYEDMELKFDMLNKNHNTKSGFVKSFLVDYLTDNLI